MKGDADAKVKAAEEGGAVNPAHAKTVHGMADVDGALDPVEEHTEKNPFMRSWANMKASKFGQSVGNSVAFKHMTYVRPFLPYPSAQFNISAQQRGFCAWKCGTSCQRCCLHAAPGEEPSSEHSRPAQRDKGTSCAAWVSDAPERHANSLLPACMLCRA